MLSVPQLVSGAVAVLYPEVKDPYHKIFMDILRGIKGEAGRDVSSLALNGSHDPDSVNDWLKQQDADSVIALGNRGKKIAATLANSYNTITGASILSDKNIADGIVGISLTPSPAELFSKALELIPRLKKVQVIYHENTNEWLVSLAKASAADLGLELIAYKAGDVRAAAELYQAALESSRSQETAIWLLQGDPTLDERSLLPNLLRQAWNKNVIVFSSNPSHVRRGALFSLFPDNAEMGKRLAQKALAADSVQQLAAEPLKDLRIAVNIRTASHLNLNISRARARDFDLIFPSR